MTQTLKEINMNKLKELLLDTHDLIDTKKSINLKFEEISELISSLQKIHNNWGEQTLTLGEFRKMTAHLDDATILQIEDRDGSSSEHLSNKDVYIFEQEIYNDSEPTGISKETVMFSLYSED